MPNKENSFVPKSPKPFITEKVSKRMEHPRSIKISLPILRQQLEDIDYELRSTLNTKLDHVIHDLESLDAIENPNFVEDPNIKSKKDYFFSHLFE